MRKSVMSMGILVGVIGLMMLVVPEAVIKIVVIVLGISGVVNGLYNIFTVRKLVDDRDFKTIITIRGTTSILVGLVAVILPMFLAGTIWIIMIYMLAIYLIFSAAMEIAGVMRMKTAGVQIRGAVAEIVACIILAAILFAIPATIGLTIVRVIGGCTIAAGIGFIIWEWKNKPLVVYAESVPAEEDESEQTKKTDSDTTSA